MIRFLLAHLFNSLVSLYLLALCLVREVFGVDLVQNFEEALLSRPPEVCHCEAANEWQEQCFSSVLWVQPQYIYRVVYSHSTY